MTPRPAQTCPLCGGANECGPARSGSFDAACWCTGVAVDPSALARLPDAARGRACLCPRCATGAAARRAASAVPGA